MRKVSPKAYGPFIALALLQGAVMLAAPSTGPDRQVVAGLPGGASPTAGTSGGAGGASGATGAIDPATGQPIDVGTTGAIDPATGQPIDAGATGGTGAAPAAGDPAQAAAAAGGGAAGDTSHCVEGRQHNKFAFITESPPCKPKWQDGADNGGATYRGVTGEEIKVVVFETVPNEAVNAVLRPQGLAATEQDLETVRTAAEGFINANYETYGRKVVLERYKSQCPTSPPDVPRCKAEAREVLKKDPFIIIFPSPLYASVFDEWARAGVISVGGWHFAEEYFTQRRPFRYDVFMDGTQSAHFIAEYYCKKLAGKPASNAGLNIHPTIGGRNTPRKLGIIVPEIEANVITAKIVQQEVKKCEGGKYEPPIFTYVSDIDRAAEQVAATTSGLISAKVTTVVCMCDPVAPAFGTKGYTSNSYFPENLLPGLGLLDHDKLGRLYDQEQWTHAFGPSHLPNSRPFADEQVSRVYKDQKAGTPCQSCNLPWVYYAVAASMVHATGPNLNPLTVEEALLNSPPVGGWEESGHNGLLVRVQLGQGDYTALSDVREAYWDPTATSKVDGQPGAYIPMEDGRRYQLGEFPANFAVPAKDR